MHGYRVSLSIAVYNIKVPIKEDTWNFGLSSSHSFQSLQQSRQRSTLISFVQQLKHWGSTTLKCRILMMQNISTSRATIEVTQYNIKVTNQPRKTKCLFNTYHNYHRISGYEDQVFESFNPLSLDDPQIINFKWRDLETDPCPRNSMGHYKPTLCVTL